MVSGERKDIVRSRGLRHREKVEPLNLESVCSKVSIPHKQVRCFVA